jgi:PDZ domain-containing protein
VSDRTLTLWDAVWVWVDPNRGAIARDRLRAPGTTDEQQEAENFRDMEESKISAEVAAFRALGMRVTVLPGARVLTVIRGAAAEGKLEPQDLITGIDGNRVRSPEEAVELVRRRRIGERVRFEIVRGGKRRGISIRTRPSIADPRKPAVGVTLGRAFRLPHRIEIDTEQIGGPSGGLVFALSIVDAFTREDLTRGHVVAATGTIEVEDGIARVGRVGAIQEKVRAAHAAGADVFLVPAEEVEEARQVAPNGLQILGARTLGEAIAALRGLPQRAA